MDQQGNKPNKNRGEWGFLLKIGLIAFVVIALSILLYFAVLRFDGVSSYWNGLFTAIQSIIFGLVIAYLINPIMKFFEKLMLPGLTKRERKPGKGKKLARGFSVTIAIICFVLIIALLLWAIIPAMITSIQSLSKTLPGQVTKFIETIQNRDWKFENADLMQFLDNSITTITESVQNWVKNSLMPQATTYISTITSGVVSVVKGVFNFIIGIVVAIYVLMIKETLTGQSKKIIYAIFRPKAGNVIIRTVRKTDEIFGGFIVGKLFDSAIVGVLCFIGCLILRIPNPLIIAVIVGVTNFIPVFGPIIGAVPCLFLVVVQNPIKALVLLIFIIALQQVDGNIIGPKILGNSTGLSTFWVMFAILLGAALWGFVGMLIGVPLFGVVYYCIGELVRFGLKKRGLSPNTSDYVRLDYVDPESKELIYLEEEKPREKHFFKKKRPETEDKTAEPEEETQEENAEASESKSKGDATEKKDAE